MLNVLLTGSTGFIGSALNFSIQNNYNVVNVVRETSVDSSGNIIEVGDFSGKTNFSNALSNINVVIHLAALAHMKGVSYRQFKEVNVEGTLALAKQAAENGVKRFIFLSSIGVNGIANQTPFYSSDNPKPVEDYATSKFEAELGLQKIAQETGMEVVIIRPPLVYGKNAPGNFSTLLKLAEKNLPLPLGAIHNDRSFVAIDNLIDLIITCIDHPKAANEIFLVSDDENISTSDLLKKLTIAAGEKPMLLPVPVSILKFIAGVLGKKAVVERFSSSLTVDIEHTKKTLNWTPPITLDDGIRRCFE